MTREEFDAWAEPIKVRLYEAFGTDPKALYNEPRIGTIQGGGWDRSFVSGDAHISITSSPCNVRQQTYKIPAGLSGDALEKKLTAIITKVQERIALGKANQEASNRQYKARLDAETFRQEHRKAHGLSGLPWKISVRDEGSNETNYRAKVTFQWLTAEQAQALIDRYNEISKTD